MTEGFDQEVQRIQKKLQQSFAPSSNAFTQSNQMQQRMQQMGYGGISKESQDAFKKATESSRKELDQLIKVQKTGYDELIKKMSNSRLELDKMVASHKKLQEGSEAEIKSREEILKKQKEYNEELKKTEATEKVLGNLLDAKQNAGPKGVAGIVDAFKSGGAKGGMQNILQSSALAGPAMIAAATAASAVISSFAAFPREKAQTLGSGAQAGRGIDLARVAAGKSPFEAMWGQQRARAESMAGEEEFGMKLGDVLGAVGTSMTLGVVGSDRTKALARGDKEGYQQLVQAANAQHMRENYESLKNQNVDKKQAIEDFEQNYVRDLGVQRSLGLSNDEFRGNGFGGQGFLKKQAAAGFGTDQAIQMANEIMGAGGSAEIAKGPLGNQMQRMGYTNAGSILGGLSGSMGTEASKQAAISTMSEAVKIGLNMSEFSEESRRFTQTATSIIARTGVTDQSGQADISAKLGEFLGQKTNAGVDAAKTAYQRTQERGSAMGGRGGALRLQKAISSGLGAIPMDELNELLNMDPEELKANPAAMSYFADKANMSQDQLIEKITGKGGVNDAGRFLLPGTRKKFDEANKTIQNYLDSEHSKGNNIAVSDLDSLMRSGQLDPNVVKAMGQKDVAISEEEGTKISNIRSSAMRGEGLRGYGTGKTPEEMQKDLQQGPGRIEDRALSEAAKSADLVREKFNLLVPELERAIAATSRFANNAVNLPAKPAPYMPIGNINDLFKPMLQDQGTSGTTDVSKGQ